MIIREASPVYKAAEVSGDACLKRDLPAGEGVFEGNGYGVEREALVGGIFFSVLLVADNRVPVLGQVHANLILSAGDEINLEQTELCGFLENSVRGV